MRNPTESEHRFIKERILNMLKGESIRNYIGLVLAIILVVGLFCLSAFGLQTNVSKPTVYIGLILLFSVVLIFFYINIKRINRYKKKINDISYQILDCVSQNIEVKYPDFVDSGTRFCATIKDKEKNKLIDGKYEILNEIGTKNFYSFSIEFKKADCILIDIEDNMQFVLYNKII